MKWERIEPGWYVAEDDSCAIVREDDGRWYVYIEGSATPKKGAACLHVTLREAKDCFMDRLTWKTGLTL